jgi:tripartite-type tricarboxylate transporter receptor subunit TctC
VLKTLAAAALGLLLAAPLSAAAQFPGKPVRLVVPFPAGSSTDIITRILANSVSQSLGQPLIVDNKAGADGAIAASEVAKAPADIGLFVAMSNV